MTRFPRGIITILASALVTALLVSVPIVGGAAASGARVGWSSAYYVAWEQGAHPPSTLPWSDISVLIHFSVKTSSARNGTINTTTHGMSPASMQATVAAAHQHGKKILLSIGGSDDLNWDAACSATYRSTFISNLVGLMRTYGYDGLDLDVEQDFGSPAHTDFIACVSGIRAALNTINPRPMLTEPGDPSWQAYMIAPVAPYLDQINLMSYWGSVTQIPAEIANYTGRGVPKTKLGVGLGLDPGMIDTNVSSCQAKTAYAANNGFGGVMEWIVTDAAAPACMAVVGSYLAGVTATPPPIPTPTPSATHSATPGSSAPATATAKATAGSHTTPSPGATTTSGGSVALAPSPSTAPSSSTQSLAPVSTGKGPNPWLIIVALALAGAVGYAIWRLR